MHGVLRRKQMKFLNTLAFILIVIGALNWGLVGFFQFDFVAWLFGSQMAGLSRLVYALVGLAGLWSLRWIPHWKHMCCCCSKDKGGHCKM